MPLQIWTQDQVPQLTMAGYGGLGGGIERGVKSFADAFKERQERERQELALGEKSRAMLAELAKADENLGLDPGRVKGMSHAEAANTLTAVLGATHFKNEQARAKREEQAAAEKLKAALAAEAARAREVPFLQDVAQYNEPGQLPYNMPAEQFNRFALPEGQTQPGLRELLASAGRTGYPIDLRTVDDLLRATNAGRNAESESFFTRDQFGKAIPVVGPDNKPIAGVYNNVLGPRQAQMFTDPSAGMQTQTITDAQGNEHTVLVQPGQRPQFAPRTAAGRGQITPVDEWRANAAEIKAIMEVPALLRDKDPTAKTRLQQLQQRQQELLGGGATPAGAAEPDAFIEMTNPAGQRVKVPRARLAEAKAKGYK